VAALQRAEHTTRLALAGIAAEAEGLQVAEVVGAAVVPGHDVVHLQGPLVRDLPSSSMSIRGWSMGLMRMRSAMVARRRS
jgi:hypothetical protein